MVQNYANVSLIVDIAERMGVHAVWAGWFDPLYVLGPDFSSGDTPQRTQNSQKVSPN
jgi:biotin carboxylase